MRLETKLIMPPINYCFLTVWAVSQGTQSNLTTNPQMGEDAREYPFLPGLEIFPQLFGSTAVLRP